MGFCIALPWASCSCSKVVAAAAAAAAAVAAAREGGVWGAAVVRLYCVSVCFLR